MPEELIEVEDEQITIKQSGWSVSVSIFMFIGINLLIILSTIGFKIIGELFLLISNSPSMISFAKYFGLLGEIIASILVIKYVAKRIRIHERFEFRAKVKLDKMHILYAVIFLAGYKLLYRNSLELLLQNIEVSSFLIKKFEEMFKDFIFLFITVVIFGPVFEEFLCRGIILEQLSKRYGWIKSVIVSALIFGIIHLNIHQSVNAFFVGLILGIVYIKTRSLLMSILLHILSNLFVFISIFIPSMQTSARFNIFGLVIGIALTAIAGRYFIKLELNDKK